MAVAVAGALVAALVGIAFLVASRVKHPEDLPSSSDAVGPSESDELSFGNDRPAGPDAEDPPTATPNRTATPPPSP